MEMITARDGVRIGVQLEGATGSPPVLVLPGGPCRDPSYLSGLAGLPGMHPLAVFHPRGTPVTRGLSNGWWNDAADVIAVADALGLHSLNILAHSAGTRLALAVAAQHPGRVRSMPSLLPRRPG